MGLQARALSVALVLWGTASCGSKPADPPDSAMRNETIQAPTADAGAPSGRDVVQAPENPKSTIQNPKSGTTVARIRVTDMEGRPLANMLPIATTRANAFDKPVATGALTGSDGSGHLSMPAGRWLCVRAWDPARRLFANNYFDVPPGQAAQTEVLEIVMLPGASLEAQLSLPDGEPARNEWIGLMMEHPARGPWWPDEAQADGQGRVRFPCVPPGRYVITLETRGGHQVQVAGVELPPGGSAQLGSVTLQ